MHSNIYNSTQFVSKKSLIYGEYKLSTTFKVGFMVTYIFQHICFIL